MSLPTWYSLNVNVSSLLCLFQKPIWMAASATQESQSAHGGTPAKMFSCCFCAKLFSFKSKLIRHEKTHTGDRPFKCSICEKTFKRSDNLYLHRRLHPGANPYQCLCGADFADMYVLKDHLKTCDPNTRIQIQPLRDPRLGTSEAR